METEDKVSLVVNGVSWEGWERVRITRGIERMPSDFAVTVTERFPSTANIDIVPGQPIVVKIGEDEVLVGFVDRYMPSIDAGQHTVEITGRGKCQDLVDCSAVFTGQAINETDAIGVANVVCKPFGITVKCTETNLRPIPAFPTILTETPFSVIDRVTRYSGLLSYEGRDGNLNLAVLGKDEMASGFQQGVNVQSARFMFSVDQRFSDVTVIMTSQNTQWQTDPNHGGAVGLSASNTIFTANDKKVARYRPHLVVSEQTDSILGTAQRRATWEINRRYGRSYVVSLVTDSWRDADGDLWEVNTLAPVDIPAIKVSGQKWLIAEVTFSKDPQRGTTAEITLMPPDAFSPEPILLFPFDQQLAQDLAQDTASTAGYVRPPSGLGPI